MSLDANVVSLGKPDDILLNINMENAPRSNIPSYICDRIVEKILSGELPANYHFPNENDLCKIWGLGRTTIREAYKTLEARGYISRTRRGTFVNATDQIEMALPFSQAIGISDFNDLTEFRAIFESHNARIAAERATDEDMQLLIGHLDKMKRYSTDLKKLTYYDTKFHMCIANATHNELLRHIMLMSSDVFASCVYKAFEVDTELNIAQALKSHEQILFGIIRGDPDAAYSAMFQHVQNILTRGIKAPDD